jgi:GT2 family glycosyltransferase
VWVIDNGSEPPARVVADPRVRLYRNPKNLGVAAGRNQGVRVGQAPFVCLLDSDASLHPNTLALLAGALDDDSELGVVGPVFDDPSVAAGDPPVGGRRSVPFVSGACQVLRRDTYYFVGGFDEWYFFGPEDVDFCLRVREAGLRVEQVTSARCEHVPRGPKRRGLKGHGVGVRWIDALLVSARAGYRKLTERPAAARRASRPMPRR